MIGDNTCPAGSGEVVAEDCRCLNEFTEAASAMSVLDEGSRDLVGTGSGTTDGQDTVVIGLLAGVAHPDFAAVSACHLVFVSCPRCADQGLRIAWRPIRQRNGLVV